LKNIFCADFLCAEGGPAALFVVPAGPWLAASRLRRPQRNSVPLNLRDRTLGHKSNVRSTELSSVGLTEIVAFEKTGVK
jgi:hypothetical protein